MFWECFCLNIVISYILPNFDLYWEYVQKTNQNDFIKANFNTTQFWNLVSFIKSLKKQTEAINNNIHIVPSSHPKIEDNLITF